MKTFYRFHFLPDGYPGRLDDDGKVFAHPLYGTYVLSDYLHQYKANPTPALAAAIRKVAKASTSRMNSFRGALVFWYEPEPQRGIRLYARHYSGLTQAYYAVQLATAGVALKDDELIDSARRVFDSLLIPNTDGGVYFDTKFGPMIAELPQEPNSWILNGWQSALASMWQYAELVDSDAARSVVRRSAKTMEAVMPLYDAPNVTNSRYGLSGYVTLRLVFGTRPSKIERVAVNIPGEGEFSLPRLNGTPWQPAIPTSQIGKDGAPKSKAVKLNAILSLASSPRPNSLRIRIKSPQATTVRLEAKVGDYDPLASAPVNLRWVSVGATESKRGTDDLSFDLPISLIKGVVGPTNFAKKINGDQVDVYHSVHINRLREIADETGVKGLLPWADKFENYICAWSQNPLYDGLKATSPGSNAVIEPSATC
jgi:hypothetical protein